MLDQSETLQSLSSSPAYSSLSTPMCNLDRPRPGKRLFDCCWAAIGLLLLSPMMLAVAGVMLLVQGRPVLFRQTRVGRYGKPFVLYKFRSMSHAPVGSGPQVTAAGDARVTPLGHWLRALKIDELPQLWNVLIGDMSLVGPRPEVDAYVQLYDENQRRVLCLVPGLTDPNVLEFLDESRLLADADDPYQFYIDSIMPEKLRVNLEYGARANFGSDLMIVLQTLMRMFRKGSKA